MEGKVKEQEVVYKKKLNELEIQKKQDRYIAKMMEEQSRRKNKTKTSLLTQKWQKKMIINMLNYDIGSY